jgi:hypothetical protein
MLSLEGEIRLAFGPLSSATAFDSGRTTQLVTAVQKLEVVAR